MGFPVPLNNWLKNDKNVKEFIFDIFKSKKAQERFYFNKKFDIEEFSKSETLYNRNLWGLLSLELWHKNFID